MHDLVIKLRWKVDNNKNKNVIMCCLQLSHFYKYLYMWMRGVDFDLRENVFHISVVNKQTKKSLLKNSILKAQIIEISLY